MQKFVVGIIGLLVLMTGCAKRDYIGGDYETIRPDVRLGRKTLAVIPFKEGKVTHFDSEVGKLLAEAISHDLRSLRKGTRLVPQNKLATTLANYDLESADWRHVAKAVGAQLILTGNIKKFQTRDTPGTNILHGIMIVEASVFSVKRNSVIWENSIRVTYPPNQTFEYGISTFDATEEQVKVGVIQECALNIAKHLRKYQRHLFFKEKELHK